MCRALLALSLIMCAIGCGKSKSPAGESESHFLMACDGNDSCGEGLVCVCGVCTLACEDDGACTDIVTGARCGEKHAMSCEDNGPERTCELPCDGDAECDIGAHALACERGRCQAKPPAPDAGPPGPGPGPGPARTCDDVRAQFDALVTSLQRCERDSDCGQPVSGTSCGCTQDLVVRSDADVDALGELIMAVVNDEQCLMLSSDCSCPAADGFQCDDGVCAWNYVDTSPEDPCPNGMIVEDAGGCLQDDAFCTALPDGRFCTGVAASECGQGAVPLNDGEECPAGHQCLAVGEGLTCVYRPIPLADCQAANGEAVGRTTPCPEGTRPLGTIAESSSLALCCSPEVATCTPQLVQYPGQTVCLTDRVAYAWNGSACIGTFDCGCRGPDCDADFPSRTACEAAHLGCDALTTPCGGFAGDPCEADELCVYSPINSCQAPDPSGICGPKPEACDDGDNQVACGCDGITYKNACEAQRAGQGILTFDGCTTP